MNPGAHKTAVSHFKTLPFMQYLLRSCILLRCGNIKTRELLPKSLNLLKIPRWDPKNHKDMYL